MASQTSKILIAFQKAGDDAVTNAFKKLGRESRSLERNFTTLSDKGIQKIKTKFNEMAKGSANSIQAMRAQKNALMGLRDMADVTGLEFKQLTADIARLDAKMRQASMGGGAGGLKGRLSGLAKGAGAIAAGGIFGGPEGAVGGAIGLKVGGPAGAAVGAAIGAQVGMVRQSIGELADFSAQLALQRKALGLVIGDTEKFAKSQEFLGNTSRKLAIPQDVITRQFTSLTASVIGAGQSVEDAEKVFLAIASGIRGTGGSLEDMKAAMRATSQVFSKGKVSAEELRQQLGERLPGAFTLFADSMDKTPAELDKALEQGKVTLDDFMKFAATLFEQYGVNAEILAQGPEAAGDRLKTQMAELKDNIGGLLRPIGAAFQTVMSAIVEDINRVTNGVKSLFDLLDSRTGDPIKDAQQRVEQARQRVIQARGKTSINPITNLPENLQMQRALLDYRLAVAELAKVQAEARISGKDGSGEEAPLTNIQQGAKAYFDTISDFGKQTQDAVSNAFKGMEDALVKFVQTGKLNFSDLARSIMADLTRMLVRASLLNFLSPFPFFDRITGGKNAMGNVYDAGNKISKFAKGGIIKNPTMFAYGSGGSGRFGLMGEAGPEAIMPLKRGSNGKLGVQATGGIGNIIVNVDASGSSVQGNNKDASQFGQEIASAVQAVIINEKRVGGLLS
mgnify:CR=1 FL=1